MENLETSDPARGQRARAWLFATTALGGASPDRRPPARPRFLPMGALAAALALVLAVQSTARANQFAEGSFQHIVDGLMCAGVSRSWLVFAAMMLLLARPSGRLFWMQPAHR